MHSPLRLAWVTLFGRDGSPRALGAADRPILLLPGFACPPRALLPLDRSLRHRLGRPTLRIDLGVGFRDIRDGGVLAHEAVEAAVRASGFQELDVVAHSMGGLVAAYLLKCVDQGRRIRRVVALGTPFQGVPLARLPGPGWLLPSVRQMRPGAPFLRHLANLPLPEGCELVSVAGGRDGVVPPRAARLPELPGHVSRVVATADHCGLVVSPEARAVVRRVLARGARSVEPVPSPHHGDPRARTASAEESGGFGRDRSAA